MQNNNLELAKKVFAKYDKDKSNNINVKELHKLCVAKGLHLWTWLKDLGYKLKGKELALAEKQLDLDGNGSISLEEFLKFWSDPRFDKLRLTEEQLKKVTQWQEFFDYWDKDGSGTLQAHEYKNVHESLLKNKIPVPADPVASFNAIDVDRSGVVDFNEFTNYLIKLKGGHL